MALNTSAFSGTKSKTGFKTTLNLSAFGNTKTTSKPFIFTAPDQISNSLNKPNINYVPFSASISDAYAYWPDVPDFNKQAKTLPNLYMRAPSTDKTLEPLKNKAIDSMTDLTPEQKNFLRNVSIVSGKQYFNPSSMPYYTGSYEESGKDNIHYDKPYIAFDKKLTEKDILAIQHELRHAIPITSENQSLRSGAGEEDFANNLTNTPQQAKDLINEMIQSGQATTTFPTFLPTRQNSNLDTALNEQLLKRGMAKIEPTKPSPFETPITGFKDIKNQPITTDVFGRLNKAQSTPAIVDKGTNPLNFAALIAQAPQRAVASVALEPTAALLSLITKKKVEPVYQPQGKLQQALLGKESVKGIFKRTEETQKTTEKYLGKEGFGKGISLGLAPLLIGGSTVLDLTPWGGGKKQVSEQVLTNLAKTVTKEGAEQIFKKAGIKYTDDLINATVKAKTIDEVKNIFNVSKQVENKIYRLANGNRVEINKIELNKGIFGLEYRIDPFEKYKITKEINPNKLVETLNKSKSLQEGIKPAIPKELESLAIEAKKYKSAEEFVQKLRLEEYKELGFKEFKPEELTTLGKGSIITTKLIPGVKFEVMESVPEKLLIRRLKGQNTINLNPKEVDKVIKAIGKPSKTTAIEKSFIDRNIQQFGYKNLTDFYNQAVKGVKEVKPTVQPPSILGTRELRGGISLTPDQYKIPRKIGEKQVELKMIESSLSKDYQKMGILSRETGDIINAEKVISPNEINPVKYGIYQKLKEGVNKYWEEIREFVEDDWIRIKNLSKRKDIKITGELTPSERRSLMYGRQQTRLEEGARIVEDIDKDILTTSKKLKIPDKELNDLANDYLIAKHAPERNIALGGKAAGVTTQEAKIRLTEIEALPYGKEVIRIADKISDYNKQVLDILYADGRPEGVITKDLYDLLRTKYKNHIPLQRVMDETEDIVQVLSNKGLDVKWSGLYRAKGSERKVADILTNVKANFDQAIQRIEKNIVDQETLKVVRANPESGLFEIIKPRAIGKTFEGKIILDKPEGLNILSMFEKGEPVYIKINDPKLAIAFKGVNRQKLDGVMRAISSVTRFMSSLATRFNPDFAFPNKIRDIQEAVVYMASKKEIGFKGAARMSLRQKESFNAIMDAFRGKDTVGARLYNQLKMDGGTTGGLAMSTRKQVIQDIEKIRKLNRSKPKKAAEYVLNKISQWNTLFEDSSRLAVYKEALNRGLIRDKAAVLAKEATVDFNKMGTGGPVINALYMFSNASIQGSAKMLRAMKNPRVLGTVVTTIGASVAVVNEYNDSMDPEWRDKVSKWDRLNGLPIVLPSDGEKFNYIVIPVSWGLKPIKVSMDYLFDTMEGKSKGVEDAVSGILTAIMEGYNPMGGTDTISAITPSVLDIPIDIARNKAWTGSKIRPDWDKYAPNSIQYFKDLLETVTGKTFIGITDKLSDTSGGRIEISPADADYTYRQIIGGAGRFISKIINTISSIGKQEIPPAKEIPFISRFWRSIEAERIGAGGTEAKEIRKILESQSKERFEFSQEAERIYEEMKKLPKEQAITTFDELAGKDKKMAQKISDLANEEKKGLTYTDRLILSLGVENGERANYIFNQINKLTTKEEKRSYYQNLIDKKVITQQVSEQILELLK